MNFSRDGDTPLITGQGDFRLESGLNCISILITAGPEDEQQSATAPVGEQMKTSGTMATAKEEEEEHEHR